MAIEFHCNHCGRLIKTGDEHGGKRGKCPSCHNSVYIPTPSDQIEPLDLAPLDEAAVQEAERQARAAQELASRLRRDQALPEESRTFQTPSAAPDAPAEAHVDMEHLVTDYVECMASGDLEEAEELKSQIRRRPREADETIDRILADEMPPAALQDVPRPVLAGFLKQLRGK